MAQFHYQTQGQPVLDYEKTATYLSGQTFSETETGHYQGFETL
jgi:hypothetical protein